MSKAKQSIYPTHLDKEEEEVQSGQLINCSERINMPPEVYCATHGFKAQYKDENIIDQTRATQAIANHAFCQGIMDAVALKALAMLGEEISQQPSPCVIEIKPDA